MLASCLLLRWALTQDRRPYVPWWKCRLPTLNFYTQGLSASPDLLPLDHVHPEYWDRCRISGSGRVRWPLVGILGLTVSNEVAKVVFWLDYTNLLIFLFNIGRQAVLFIWFGTNMFTQKEWWLGFSRRSCCSNSTVCCLQLLQSFAIKSSVFSMWSKIVFHFLRKWAQWLNYRANWEGKSNSSFEYQNWCDIHLHIPAAKGPKWKKRNLLGK